MSDIILVLLTASVTLSLILTLILCICRNKSKSTSGTNNVNNLLPLNSIRSSDLQTNQLELIRYNGVNGMSTDEADHHRPHTQRALPDIPSMANGSQHMSSNEFELNHDSIQTIEMQHNIEAKPRPQKARAPQPPTHSVMTCPTIPTSDDLHHSYARIKDNAIVDSSENETDDYCDPHFCATSARNISQDSDDMSPPVPTKRFVNETNTEHMFRSSNPSTSRAAEEMQFMSGPVLLLNHSNIDSYSHSSNEENRITSNGTEISYNTISVREPLAKVLAERANTEHHYNEVEEERVSSFYEEIAGSTASSVTYSKIGDILSNNLTENSTQEMNPIVTNGRPVILSYNLDSTDSISTQPKQSTSTVTQNSDSFSLNNPKDLYSSVDKRMKSKSYNRQTIHCIPDLDNEFDNLYAKVQKVVNKPKENTVFIAQRPSSVSDVEPTLPENNTPPPLPPPLKTYQSNHSRSSRTISLYDSYNSVPKPNTSSHQRRYSSGNQSINTNDWNKRDINEEPFDYGTVSPNEIDLESDPGYEVIKKKTVLERSCVPTATALSNGFHSVSVTDPGYEAINYDENDFDPNYEVITKKVNTNRQTIPEMVDPGYEVIKRVPQKQTNSSTNRFEINRNVSDVSSEPGYERIRFTQNTFQPIDSEPNYASISRNQQFFDDEEEEQTLSERL